MTPFTFASKVRCFSPNTSTMLEECSTNERPARSFAGHHHADDKVDQEWRKSWFIVLQNMSTFM